MQRKIVLLTITLLLVFGIVQVAAAAGMGWGGDDPRMLSRANLIDELNLTDQQISKMREINQNTYKQTRDLRIKLMDSMHELKQLKLQKNPDEAQIDAKVKEIKDLREKIYSIKQQSRQECQSLLTQEQQTKMNQLKSKKGGFFRGGNRAGNTQ